MKIPVSDACFAELGESVPAGQDQLLEMPGAIPEGEVQHEQASEGEVPGNLESAPRPYEM